MRKDEAEVRMAMYGSNGPSGSKGRGGGDKSAQECRDRYISLFAKRFLHGDSTGVLILDEDFRIMEMSVTVCRLFGTVASGWLGRSAEEWFEFIGWLPYPFERGLLEGKVFQNRSLDWRREEETRYLMLDGDVLEEEPYGIVGAYVLIRDISHLTMLEEQIRRSDRLKTIGQIAAGTAHEIRNPLTAIRGFMQLMGKSLADRDMQKELEYVTIMMSELDRVNELASEFLLLSKPKEAKVEPLSVGSVLQEILPVIHSEAMMYGVDVKCEPLPDSPLVLVNKEQLKQVFLNLAKNAIEAMTDGGSLIIREYRVPDKPGNLMVKVQDTGPGIPADILGRIFDPFFTTKPQGTGLGLSICQRIVHDLGGFLGAESDGDGTCFTMLLPLSETPG